MVGPVGKRHHITFFKSFKFFKFRGFSYFKNIKFENEAMLLCLVVACDLLVV